MIKKILILVAIISALFTTQLALGANVNVTVGDGSGNPGDTNIEIPISVSDVTGLGIISAQLQLNYDPSRLTFASLTTLGTIAQIWGNPIYNANTPGQIAIAMYGITALSGQGILIKIYFDVKPQAAVGTSSLTLVRASFGSGHTSTIQNGTFTVLSQERPPILDLIGDKEVDEGATLIFNISATDPDVGDILTYSASNLPTGAAFDSQTQTFSWTPTYEQAETYPGVHFEVSDGRGGVDSEDITITVNNVNRPPEISAIPSTLTKNEGEALTQLEIELAIDPDGDVLTYIYSGWLSSLPYDITYVDAGEHTLHIEVSDGVNPAQGKDITITVNNVPQPPVLSPIGNKPVNEGELLEFTLSAEDIDGDILTYSASNLPTGATFDSQTQTFSWTPTYEQAETYPGVHFEVSDGSFSDEETITITVNNVNRAPTVVSFSPSSSRLETDNYYYTFTTVFSDLDGYNDLNKIYLLINTSANPQDAFYAYYHKAENKLYLYNGSGFSGGYAPGSNKVIDTPYGKLICAYTYVLGSGNNLTVRWRINFKSSFGGTKNVYLSASDISEASTGWQQKATIIINAPPVAVSVSPNAGTFQTDTAYTFSTLFSDLNGYNDLNRLYLLISTGTYPLPQDAFYARYNKAENKLYLYKNTFYGWAFYGGYAPGSNMVIDTPYGKLYCADTTVSGSGNDLTINWRISFKPSFAGTKNVYLYAYDTRYAFTKGWQQKGTITITSK